MDQNLVEISEMIKELLEDPIIPKNVRDKLSKINQVFDENAELSLIVNKALDSLDEISNDSNLQAFTRTQLWNIVSALESIPI